MYYPDVEELKDVVICDPQIVFDSITELILNTFKFEAVRKAACDKFKYAGQFSFNDIKKLSESLKSGILPLPQLVKLLEYLYIIARISYPEESGAASTEAPQSASVADVHDENVVYFMPAVLQSAGESELNVSHNPVDPAPLLIRFKSGIVPLGLFCASIASLVARKKLGWKLQGANPVPMAKPSDELRLYKNRVTFRVNRYSGSYNVTLISKPKRYEVHIQTISSPVDRPRHYICQHVLNIVSGQTLDHVISKMRHKQNLSLSSSNSPTVSPYELGFQCPLHPDEDHMAVCSELVELVNHLAVCSELGELVEPSLSAADQWFAYFENGNTTLLCLDENVVVHLTNSRTHDTSFNPQGSDSSLQHGGGVLENSHVGGVSVSDKYGLWMGPPKVDCTNSSVNSDGERSIPSEVIVAHGGKQVSPWNDSQQPGAAAAGDQQQNRTTQPILSRADDVTEKSTSCQVISNSNNVQPQASAASDEQSSTTEQPMYITEEIGDIMASHKPKPDKQVEAHLLKDAVQLILLTCNENEKWAVYEKLDPPSVDPSTHLERALYLPKDNAVIGTFANYMVAVLTTEQGKKAEIVLKQALDTFPKAEAIIGVGFGYGRNPSTLELADVMVSDHIEDASQVSIVEEKIKQCGPRVAVKNELLRYFKGKTMEWKLARKFKVTKEGRIAQAKVATIVSSETLMRSKDLKEQYMKLTDRSIGGEMEGCVLLNMIDWMEREKKHRSLSVIVIKGVADYGDNQEDKRWQFTAAKAAVDFVHYCLEETGGEAKFNTAN